MPPESPRYIKVPLSELSQFTRVPKEQAPLPRPRENEGVALDTARDLIGRDSFFGPDALATAFAIDLDPRTIPPIPFTEQELKEAKRRGEYLIYRTDTLPDGTPLTMQKIAELVEPVLTANGQGKARYDNNDWCAQEPFYTAEPPRAGWALVSKEVLSDTKDKNYLQQTDRLVEEAEGICAQDPSSEQSKQYREAIEEFRRERPTIEQLIKDSQWQDASQRLANLWITHLTRQTAPEAYFDAMLLRAITKQDSLLSNIYTWTSSRSSSGDLVGVGSADSDGAYVDGWDPDVRRSDLGVLLARRGPGVSSL